MTLIKTAAFTHIPYENSAKGLSYYQKSHPFHPDSACDTVYDSLGDSITIAGSQLPVNLYVDCLWVLSKSALGSSEFNRLYVKVQDFSVGFDWGG